MHILIKVLLITLLSVLVSLIFFDYDSSEVQLNLSSKTNCVDLGMTIQNYICNTCFKVSPKNKPNEQIIIESQQPFMLVSLKEQVSGILSCEEWLQAVDYESIIQQDPYHHKILRLQPTVNRFLSTLQKQHNQILLIQRPHLSNQRYPTNLKQYSSLQRPYQVLSYYSRKRGATPFRVFLTNDLIKNQSVHILTLLTIAAAFAVLYSLHRGGRKNLLQKYRENILSLIGIMGALVWVIYAGLGKRYELYMTFCKILFFSLSLSTIFGTARWIFFGIITIIYTLITLKEISALYRSFFEISLLFILVLKLCTDIKREYYHLEKNSNKKIFFLLMSLLVVGCSIASFIEDDSTLGQIFTFLQGLLINVSLLIGVKNLDGDTYHKILTEQKKGGKGIDGETSIDSLGTETYMYEETQGFDQTELRQIKK